jgi:hypothetical protein
VNDTNHSKLSEDDNLPKFPIHADGCWSWGPAHYACACAEIAKLRGWHAQSGQDQAR